MLAVSRQLGSEMDAGAVTECAGYLTQYVVLRLLLQHLYSTLVPVECKETPLCKPDKSLVS